jgi:hypothetical protein
MTAVHLAHFPADEPLSAWVAVPLGVLIIGLALAAAAVGLMMNIDFAVKEGLDVWKTAAYAGVDVAEFVMPVVIVARGWPWYKRGPAFAVWGVFLVISAFCIFSSVANVEAKRMKEVAVAENVYRDAEGRKKAADATLADPAVAHEHTSVAELETLAKETSAAAEREGARGTCGAKCESAHADHRKLLERVGVAKSRDAANATLRDVSQILVKGLPEPAGFAVILAGPLGVDVKTLSRGHSMATSLGAVVAIKLAVLFFTPVGAWLLFRGGRRKAKDRTVDDIHGSDAPTAPLASPIFDNIQDREDAEFDAPAPVVRRITSKATESLGGNPAVSEASAIQGNDLALAENADVAAPLTVDNMHVEASESVPVVTVDNVHGDKAATPIVDNIHNREDRPTATVTRLTPPPKVEETGQGAEVRTWLRETLATNGPTLRSDLIASAAPRFNRHAVTRAIARLECKVDPSAENKRDALISLPRRKRNNVGF